MRRWFRQALLATILIPIASSAHAEQVYLISGLDYSPYGYAVLKLRISLGREMYQGQIRTLVAIIILGGHFAVFLAGLLLGVFGPLIGADALQTVLMASPILGVTAASALKFALTGEQKIARGFKVTALFACVTIFFPSALIFCIFVVFYAVYKQVTGFGPDEMKIALGGIETFFGVFLGAISDTLFGKPTAR